MHPIERLRWIARADGESAASLASEAAFTLGELAEAEPAAVLTACRRLLERHPSCGPLYWTSARLLAAADPSVAAQQAASELWNDETAEHVARELAATFTPGTVLATAEPAELVAEALRRRGRFSVRYVAEFSSLRLGVRALASVADDVTGFDRDECEEALEGAEVAVVEALAAGPALVLLSPAAAALSREAAASDVPVWLCVGAGRALPAGLAAAAARASLGAGAAEVLAPDEFNVALGPDGPADPAVVVSRATCPPGTELVGRS